MGLQTGKIKFTGKLGDLVGYCRNGKYYLRSMPVNVRQTAATKEAARRFGVVSKQATLLRRAFGQLYGGNCDSTLHNRLIKQLLKSKDDA